MKTSSPEGLRAGRRRLLGGMALWLGMPVGATGKPEPLPAGKAGRPEFLPARQLRVELRFVSLGPGSLPPPSQTAPPGSLVVSSAGAPARSAAGELSTRSADAAPPAWPGVELVVANGERAQVRWQEERPLPPQLFVWGAAGARVPGRPSSPRTLAGVGLDLRSERRLALRRLDVLPRWPGGTLPAQLSVSAEQPAAPDALPPTPGLAVQTVLSLPLGRWTMLARSVEVPGAQASADGVAGAAAALELQVRVTLAPD